MSDIFISYASEDKKRVQGLVHALEEMQFSVFWDRNIPPGEDWRTYIPQALDEAKCVIVAWSRHSIQSNMVAEEADEGKKRKILVPVLLDSLEYVELPFGFRSIHAVDLIDSEKTDKSHQLELLLGKIEELLKHPAKKRNPQSRFWGRPLNRRFEGFYYWLSKGLYFSNLYGKDAHEKDMFIKSRNAFVFGVGVSCMIQFLGLIIYTRIFSINQFISIPIFGIFHFAKFLIFILIFYISLTLLRVKVNFTHIAIFTFFTFSASTPILSLLSAELLNYKMALANDLIDSSRPYTAGAIERLSYEDVAQSFQIRHTIYLALQAIVVVLYLLINLTRVTLEYVKINIRPKNYFSYYIRTIISIILALSATLGLIWSILGRIYWSLMGVLITIK